MYLIAYYSPFFTDHPVSIEVPHRAGVSCLLQSFNQSKISYVVRFEGSVLDHNFWHSSAPAKLYEFMHDEVEHD